MSSFIKIILTTCQKQWNFFSFDSLCFQSTENCARVCVEGKWILLQKLFLSLLFDAPTIVTMSLIRYAIPPDLPRLSKSHIFFPFAPSPPTSHCAFRIFFLFPVYSNPITIKCDCDCKSNIKLSILLIFSIRLNELRDIIKQMYTIYGNSMSFDCSMFKFNVWAFWWSRGLSFVFDESSV